MKADSERIEVSAVVGWLHACGWVFLLALLGACLPLFLCMPPWVDNTFFDLCARTVLEGRLLYREVFLHGLPGMVLLQAAVRGVAGWRSEVLLGADFIAVCGMVLLLVLPLARRSSAAATVWTAAALFLFYFSTSEWCHAQPDTWMLLPSLAAVNLRRRRLDRMAQGGEARRAPALAEGALWGIACLLKPFPVVPAAVCWLVSGSVARRLPLRSPWLVPDTSLCLAGGCLAVGAVLAWIRLSGNWADFVRTAMSDWNQEYYATSVDWMWRSRRLLTWFGAWSLVHLAAVPIAVFRIVHIAADEGDAAREVSRRQALLGALYLGWLIQATYLQREFVYQQVPAVLLGIGLVAGERWPRRVLIPIAMGWSLWHHPLMNRERLALWPRCWRDGSTAALRNALTLEADPAAADWLALGRVRDYLEGQGLHDRELTCYAVSSVHLYKEMHLRPSTRFILLGSTVGLFRGHQDAIRQALLESPERLIVSDLRQLGMSERQATEVVGNDPLEPPLPADERRAFRSTYPGMFPIVFRAGRYLVHRVPPGHRVRETSP